MADITLDIPTFRAFYPEFANTMLYPDVRLNATFNMSTGYISSTPSRFIKLAIQQQMLDLFTAHLLAVNSANGTGGSKQVTSAKIGDESITVEPPPTKNTWDYWLSLTPYGLQYLALLNAVSAGGFYAGGRPEVTAMRRAPWWFGR